MMGMVTNNYGVSFHSYGSASPSIRGLKATVLRGYPPKKTGDMAIAIPSANDTIVLKCIPITKIANTVSLFVDVAEDTRMTMLTQRGLRVSTYDPSITTVTLDPGEGWAMPRIDSSGIGTSATDIVSFECMPENTTWYYQLNTFGILTPVDATITIVGYQITASAGFIFIPTVSGSLNTIDPGNTASVTINGISISYDMTYGITATQVQTDAISAGIPTITNGTNTHISSYISSGFVDAFPIQPLDLKYTILDLNGAAYMGKIRVGNYV